ncbi:MAG: DNA polymerase domain-containing protein [Chloroflexi bacterium]|nr:DNA polymerase domain-containing protein [Chloroflexota bacterium]
MAVTINTWEIGERSVSVSNLSKVFWPEDGLTKEDMLRYYQIIAPTLLPYLKERPVTLRVFPDGIHGFSYYRRDLPEHAPTWLRSVDYQPETANRVIQLPLIDDVAGLVWLANEGSIEFHLWCSRAPDLAEPDMVVFDLDPGDEAGFVEVLQASLRLRDALDRLGLRSYPKTSGGRGVHVYLPLAPGHTYEAVRAWVRDMAEQLSATYPDLIAVAHGPTHQGRQVTIDHAQNSVGRNTAAPYTLRARPGAPVSTPLTWEEVEAGQVRPSDLTLRVLPQRLQQVGDLFAPVLQGGQVLH